MYLALDNIRSLYNVGSVMRTAEFLGIKNLILLGYSGGNKTPNGSWQLNERVKKTALGAEKNLKIKRWENLEGFIKWIKDNKLKLVAIEQDKKSIDFDEWQPTKKDVIVLGNEIEGVRKEILKKADQIVEIKRRGKKKSLNVAVTAGIVIKNLVN